MITSFESGKVKEAEGEGWAPLFIYYAQVTGASKPIAPKAMRNL